MDWAGLLARDDGVRLRNAATEDALRSAEADLGAGLPDVPRCLYRLTDGVWDEPGQWYVIWPLAEVALRNRNEAGQALPRDLIAFGDDGTGDPWCVRRDGEPLVAARLALAGHHSANGAAFRAPEVPRSDLTPL